MVWEPRWHALARRYGGWRQDKKRRKDDGIDVPDLDGLGAIDDFWVGVAVIIGLIVFGLLFWWLLLPLLLLVLDVVAVGVLLVVGVLGRVLFRRPWKVQATGGADAAEVTAWVVGWRAALRTRDEMADRLRLAGTEAFAHDGAFETTVRRSPQ